MLTLHSLIRKEGNIYNKYKRKFNCFIKYILIYNMESNTDNIQKGRAVPFVIYSNKSKA